MEYEFKITASMWVEDEIQDEGGIVQYIGTDICVYQMFSSGENKIEEISVDDVDEDSVVVKNILEEIEQKYGLDKYNKTLKFGWGNEYYYTKKEQHLY